VLSPNSGGPERWAEKQDGLKRESINRSPIILGASPPLF
jgi:hypothetical protein